MFCVWRSHGIKLKLLCLRGLSMYCPEFPYRELYEIWITRAISGIHSHKDIAGKGLLTYARLSKPYIQTWMSEDSTVLVHVYSSAGSHSTKGYGCWQVAATDQMIQRTKVTLTDTLLSLTLTLMDRLCHLYGLTNVDVTRKKNNWFSCSCASW